MIKTETETEEDIQLNIRPSNQPVDIDSEDSDTLPPLSQRLKDKRKVYIIPLLGISFISYGSSFQFGHFEFGILTTDFNVCDFYNEPVLCSLYLPLIRIYCPAFQSLFLEFLDDANIVF